MKSAHTQTKKVKTRDNEEGITMKQIEGHRKKGRLPIVAFLAGTLIGSCILISQNHQSPEETEAHAEPLNYTTVPEYHTAILTDLDVPAGDTAFKSYMSYKAITNKRSAQYMLQQDCWTDKNGLRRYDDKYVIALGSFYTESIGEEFKITLDTGKTFRAVVGDFKADRHTDRMNQYTPMDGRKCVIEFVVDTPSLDTTAKKMGDISYIRGFDGNIQKIERIE